MIFRLNTLIVLIEKTMNSMQCKDIFSGKVIMIIGGTGSFGHKFTEIVLQRYKPRKLIIFSRDEVKQYEMAQEFNTLEMRYFIGDVRDCERLTMAMRGVNYVLHAAALKQVSTAEYNPMECVKTNVYGAENVVKAALANNVEKVIAMSTDKAANPINLYGATKLCSDKIFTAANNIAGGNNARFSVVRYGNVVASRGSVVPYFKKLMNNGSAYLPITHEQMTRFWITLQQGVEFVCKSFELMLGGELFVPKIPSVRIVDLARAMAPDLPHKIIGIRPGEKIHEVMCPKDDSHLTVEFKNHFVITPSIKFYNRGSGFFKNVLGEEGNKVPQGFEYNSGNNPYFLSIPEIIKYNHFAGILD